MPTVSLRQTLARRPGGDIDSGIVRWSDVGEYLRIRYLDNDKEKGRKEKAAKRQRLYQCAGDNEMLEMLRKVFSSDEVIELRRQWIEFAKFDNLIRRVVHELATVYASPATRKVGGSEENEANYREVQRLCRQDEVMPRINQLGFLHRALAVGPRMRENPAQQWEPVIDVVTPACFSAVRDPLDPTQLIAFVFENDYALRPGMSAGPRWRVVGWHEQFMMSSHFEVLENTIEEHGIGEIPWLLLTLEPPDGELIDCHTGDDLVSAQLMTWFLHVLYAKELKSATKQTMVLGDTSNALRNQVNDTDSTGALPEGVQVQTTDRSMDVSIFPAGTKHVGETTGSNYGLASSVLRGDSEASAEARDRVRIPLREQRLRQQIPCREFERNLARLQSIVVSQKRPDLAFTVENFTIDFADPQTPLGTKEANEVFEQERRLTLTSTKREVRRRNPDLDDAAAEAFIIENIEDELERNLAMKPLQQVSGSPGADMEDAGSGGATTPTDSLEPPVMRVIRGGVPTEVNP